MRGRPALNFPAFFRAAEALRRRGYIVFSPAEKGCELLARRKPSLQGNLAFRRKVFALDTEYICKHADVVYMLPGWRKSKGARAEKALAEAIGLPVRKFRDRTT